VRTGFVVWSSGCTDVALCNVFDANVAVICISTFHATLHDATNA